MPVYIGIIETIGERLYTGRVNWLREYIQNAIDAKASTIEISIRGGDLVIKDNGNGMDDADLIQEAFSLGGSTKGPDEIGELGIGMFAGVGISNRVIVLTKMATKPAYLATFDVLSYKQLKHDHPEMLFDDAIGRVFKVVQAGSGADPDDHFTEIKFEKLGDRPKKLLEEGKLAEFIRTTVNIPMDDSFPWKKEVEVFLGKDQKKTEVSLITEEGPINLRRFGVIKEALNEPITVPIKDGIGNQIGKLWACYAKQGLGLKSPGAGLFVKFKGMTVGDDSAIKFRFGAKDSGRFLGELVVSNIDGLTINTERTWFSDSDQLAELEKRGKEAFQHIHSIAEIDTKIGMGLIRKQERVNELTVKIDQKIASRDFGQAGKLREQQNRLLTTIKDKEKVRATTLTEIKKNASESKSPIEKAKLEILSKQELKVVTLTSIRSLPKEERKRSNERYIMTLLGNYIIDPKIAEEASGKNMKDTTNNVFTLIETEMKRKIGIPEKKHIDFGPLLTQFKTRCRDINEPNGSAEIARHSQAFDQLMWSLHFLLRNPSAHTFMKDMDNARSICQVLLMGDFVLRWLDSWEVRSP